MVESVDVGSERQYFDDPRCRGLPFGAGVELGSGAPQRDEDLGSDQKHRHGGLQVEFPPQQAQAQCHGNEPDAESCDQIHGECGQEGDA